MANKNYQIAKFYSLMYELKETLNGDLLPLAERNRDAHERSEPLRIGRGAGC